MSSSAHFEPLPLATEDIIVPPELLSLLERLAQHNHNVWAEQRIKEGWCYGERRDEYKREHPCLVEYDHLPDSEKEYDRRAALETIKAVIKLGYTIVPPKTNV